MDKITLAYLAGVVDSDGCISIKRRRHKDGGSGWTYHPLVQIRQVETAAVTLAQKVFRGNLRLDAPAGPNRRPMHTWQVTSAQAVAAAKLLLPYLRIKREQARLVIEFGGLRADPNLRRRSYWFTITPGEPMCTPAEAAESKGVDRDSIYQAIRNGSIPATKEGGRFLVPVRFLKTYTMARGQHPLPEEYIKLREEIHAKAKFLNRTGPR